MASRTRLRVSGEIDRRPVITYETVLCDTPATRATSLLVTTAPRHRYASTVTRHTVAIRSGDDKAATASRHAGADRVALRGRLGHLPPGWSGRDDHLPAQVLLDQ